MDKEQDNHDRDYDAFPIGNACECCGAPISKIDILINGGKICNDCKELADDL